MIRNRRGTRRAWARVVLASALGALALAPAGASGAGPTVTIGPSLDPALGFGASCSPCTALQAGHPTATLASPVDGAVQRWRFKTSGNWGDVRLRVLRPIGDGTWQAVRSTAVVTQPTTAGIHEFEANLPISAGDHVAIEATSQFQGWSQTGASLAYWQGHYAGGSLLDGQTRAPHYSTAQVVPLQADIGAPDNRFQFAGLRRNKRRGTAKLAVRLPGPGRAVIARTPTVKRASIRTTRAGRARLAVVPRGRARGRLRSAAPGERVRTTVRARVTFKPTNGEPRTKVKRLRLVRRG